MPVPLDLPAVVYLPEAAYLPAAVSAAPAAFLTVLSLNDLFPRFKPTFLLTAPSDHVTFSLVLPRLELEIRCDDRFEVGCENDHIDPGPDHVQDRNGEQMKTHSTKNLMSNLN